MIGFSLTQEQKELKDSVRNFVRKEIMPKTLVLDHKTNPEDCFSWEIIGKLSALGLRTFMLPAKESPADALTSIILLEELAYGDIGIAIALGQTWKVTRLTMKHGTPVQKEKFLADFYSDTRFLLAIAITEPDFSSDYILPYGKSGGPGLAANFHGDFWRLNGTKHFIANGGTASLYAVFAKTKRSKDFRNGTTAFLVPRNSPGFSIGRIHDKSGKRLITNAELIFNNCYVPVENQLGDLHRGYEILTNFFPLSNAYAGAEAIGLARRIYDESVKWAKVRVQGGKPIIGHQSVGVMLSEMKMLIDASRAYVWQTAWSAETPEYFDPTFIPLANVFTSRMVMRVAELALEIHGGYGMMREMEIEKLFRDAAMCLHSDGANNTLLLKALDFIKKV